MQAEDSHAADEAAMRESVKQMETGWNTKSGALFAKPFAEDADYVVINGKYIKGRAVIETQHQRIFDTIFKDTNINLTVKQIRFLRPDVAVVHVEGRRTSADERARSGRDTDVGDDEREAGLGDRCISEYSRGAARVNNIEPRIRRIVTRIVYCSARWTRSVSTYCANRVAFPSCIFQTCAKFA